MQGRGTRLFIPAMAFCLIAVAPVQAAPAATVPMPRIIADERVCQDKPQDIDYRHYFTAPEREGSIMYVFYNNIIDSADDSQFGYALLYGLDFAAENAKDTDTLAVGIYFANNKGKIYFIRKKAFLELQDKGLPVDQLLKNMMVKEVDTARS